MGHSLDNNCGARLAVLDTGNLPCSACSLPPCPQHLASSFRCPFTPSFRTCPDTLSVSFLCPKNLTSFSFFILSHCILRNKVCLKDDIVISMPKAIFYSDVCSPSQRLFRYRTFSSHEHTGLSMYVHCAPMTRCSSRFVPLPRALLIS